MTRREEKRRDFHEALLRTLYPPPSSPSPPPSPPPPAGDDEPFDVTLIDPEDYVKIGSSDNEDDYKSEDGDVSETAEKLSRAQRKRLRKKALREEAARRRKLVGPLLPSTMAENGATGADVHIDSEVGSSDDGDGSGEQSVRGNAQEMEEKSSGRDKMGKVKRRRAAKKLARESSKQIRFEDHPTPETQN